MNATSEKVFQHCILVQSTYQILVKIPSKAYFNKMISACSFIMLLMIPTILLNGLSVFAIKKCSQLKEKIPYFLIMVQSIADLAVGFITIPLMSYVCMTQVLGKADCLTQRILINIATFPASMSIICLTAMTVDRYLSVVYPLKHRTKVTKRKISNFIVYGNMFIFAIIALSVLKTEILVAFHSVYLFLFLVLAVFMYTKIFIAIKTRKRPGNVGNNIAQNNQNERNILQQIKLVKSCFLAVACFLLCFLASASFLIFQPYSEDTPNSVLFKMWTGTASFLNASLNSIIFFWTRPLLRTEAMKLLKKMCRNPGLSIDKIITSASR